MIPSQVWSESRRDIYSKNDANIAFSKGITLFWLENKIHVGRKNLDLLSLTLSVSLILLHPPDFHSFAYYCFEYSMYVYTLLAHAHIIFLSYIISLTWVLLLHLLPAAC